MLISNSSFGAATNGGVSTALMSLSNSANNKLTVSGTSATDGGVVTIGRHTGSGTGGAIGTLTIGHLDPTSSITSTNNGTGTLLSQAAAANKATGTLNLNGGGLTITTTGSAIAGGTNGTSTVNFNGTTLKAGANSGNWITGLTNANVADGGLKVDSNGFALTSNQIFKHGGVAATDGGLTKSGTGSLTLGGTNTYNGPTAINGGLANVTGSITSNVAVASGASVGGTGTINGSLTFANNTELQVPVNGSFLTANTVDATGSVVTITPLGVIPGTPTTILNAPGGITGTIGTNVVLLSRGTISEIDDTQLQLVSAGAASLIWSGEQSTAWNIQQTQNWVNGATPDVSFNLDNNTYTGGTTINAGTLQLGDGTAATGSVAGAITNNATLAVNYGANNGSLANVISGTGGLNKDGTGTLRVSAANTYAGTTNVNAGTIQLDGTGTLGTGPVVDNAALVANTTTTLANNISGTGTASTAASSVLTITGTNSYSGGTTIAAGTTLNVGNGGTTGTLGNGPITNAGTLAFNRSDFDRRYGQSDRIGNDRLERR